MADSKKQYTAIFAIGAKLLGSFKGVMASAQARMQRLTTASTNMAKGVLSFVNHLGLLGLASFGVGAILHKVFGEAGMEAREAEQRTRALTAALLQNDVIRKGGPELAKRQLELIYKHNEALEQQGVLHKDILDTMSVQLALKAGLPPKQLTQSNDVLQDILVTTKGITASEGDAASLATAYAAAVAKGRLLGLSKQGVTITKEFAKSFAKLTSTQARQNALMAHFGKLYKNVNKEARNTPLGKIQLFHNAIKSMSQEIGNELLPLQAEMADGWLKALPVTKPLIIGALKKVGNAAIWATRQMNDFFAVIAPPPEAKPKVELFTRFKQQLGPFDATTGMKEGIDTTSDAMNQWTKGGVGELNESLRKLSESFDNLGLHMKLNGQQGKSFGQVMSDLALIQLGSTNEKIKELNQLIETLGKLWKQLESEGTVKQIMDNWNKSIKDLKTNLQDLWAWLATNLTNEALWSRFLKLVNRDTGIPQAHAAASQGGFATGGIVRQPTFSMVGERGPEAIIPLGGGPRAQGLLNYANRAMGRTSGGLTNVTFAPNVTINGNASESDQRTLDTRLRSLAKDFITQFKAAQRQERRLSYESGYA